MSHTAKIEVKHVFSNQDIQDIIATALEGGINYWCGCANKMLNTDGTLSGVLPEDRSNVHFKSDVIAFGGTLILFDVDYATTKQIWYLNIEKLLNGIAMFCKESGVKMEELIDQHDAADADQIVQYALFGKLVYA